MKLNTAKLLQTADRLLASVDDEKEASWIVKQREIQDVVNLHGLKFTLKIVIEPYKEIRDSDIVRVSYFE